MNGAKPAPKHKKRDMTGKETVSAFPTFALSI